MDILRCFRSSRGVITENKGGVLVLEFQGGRSSRDPYLTLGSTANELYVYRTGPVLLNGEQLLQCLVEVDGLARGRLIGDGIGDGEALLMY